MALSVVETVVAEAATYNLTDLDTAHCELKIPDKDTSNDKWLSRAVTQASKAAQALCKQPLVVESVLNTIDIEQDPYPYQTPGGVRPLQLSRFPLISVGTVLQTIALNTTQTLVLGTDYRIDADAGQLIRLNPFTGVATTWEALPLSVPFVAGMGAVATESYTVASPSYQYTPKNAAQFSIDQGVVYASSGIALTPIASGAPTVGQYLVTIVTDSLGNRTGATYQFAAADVNAAVNITYGYNDIEDDVIDAVLRLITARWSQRGRDAMLMEETTPQLGTKRYWVPDPSKANGAISPEIQGLLDPYRVPSVA
ncbi:MAG TPA: hypothetical protein VKR31_00820 [Rhizomicrobium sp.]|nr:hypothetical protein [Rhizomicrobium sp.]